MEKWDYIVATWEPPIHPDKWNESLTTCLNLCGKEGWELVQIIENKYSPNFLIFKRPTPR